MNKNKSDSSENESDSADKTIVTAIERVGKLEEEKAYILFISGPLIGKMYLLDQEETLIGRADDVDISIRDNRVSRRHLRIILSEGQAIIEDMGSTNGTFVNGERVKRRPLENGDKVHISSDTLFKFAVGDEAERMFQEEMHQMANYDAVTGILNKHALTRRLKEEFSYAKRSKWGLAILMIDIDFFKNVNDTYGHMAGDYVLSGVAKRIEETIRDEDILARYGGEEFVAILRGTDIDGAKQLAERVRKLVEAKPFKFEKHDIPITISIGVSHFDGKNFDNAKVLVEHADKCLYTSKQTGRNKVTA